MDNYEFLKDIGAGSFGFTKLMRNKTTKELVAMKFIERGPMINENVAREIINHRSLSHPNIIKFQEVLLAPTYLVILMEYAAGGELYDRIRTSVRFGEDEARYFFQQLISGVSYCHDMQVSHRDLKLANTLLDGNPIPKLKICDFGQSMSSVLDSQPNSIAGTLRYIAPQVLSGREYDGKADIWSCGVTLYVMLVGAYPFEDEKEPENFEKTTQRILGAQYKIPDFVDISEECRHLLSRIFVARASRMITIQEIKIHPWFLKNLSQELYVSSQATIYNKRDDTYCHQSLDEIMEIVKEARNPAINPPPVSSSIEWAEEENLELEVEEEEEYEVEVKDEYEVAEENVYDKKVREVYEDKQVKEVYEVKQVKELYKSKSLSVSGVVRSAERSLVLNQLHSDHTDPSSLAATSFDQSMFGLRLAERSIHTNQSHSYHSDSTASQSVSYAENATNLKRLDSSMYVRSAERSLESNILHYYLSHPSSASQSASFEGNPTNSISDVRSSEKSIKSNVSHPSKPSAYQRQSLGFASELDSNSWTQVKSVDPSMSDVRPAENSIVLDQLNSYHFHQSASKMQAEGPTKGSIHSKALDSNYSAHIGNFDLSISALRSAEKSLVPSSVSDMFGRKVYE